MHGLLGHGALAGDGCPGDKAVAAKVWGLSGHIDVPRRTTRLSREQGVSLKQRNGQEEKQHTIGDSSMQKDTDLHPPPSGRHVDTDLNEKKTSLKNTDKETLATAAERERPKIVMRVLAQQVRSSYGTSELRFRLLLADLCHLQGPRAGRPSPEGFSRSALSKGRCSLL